jgi:hypothetical protein
MTPPWFLYIGGFSLVVLGIMQIFARPRAPGDSLYKRFVNLGTMWSLACMTVGAGLIAMALGYWDGPLGAMRPSPPEKAQKRRHPHQPTP